MKKNLFKKALSIVVLLSIGITVPFIEFESPVSATMVPRYNAIQSMTNMKNAYWVADYQTYPYTYTQNGFVYSNSFYYYGIPYSQNYNTSLTEFCTYYGSNYKISSKSVGIDCSTAVVYALNDAGCAIGNPTSWTTGSIITSDIANNSSFKHAGSYSTVGCATGSDIIISNSTTTMYTAYANCQIGDILVHNDTAGAHAIMVTGKSITYNSNGTPTSSSTISYMDQGQGNLDTSHSSWSTGTYSFATLLSKKYIPITTSYFITTDAA